MIFGISVSDIYGCASLAYRLYDEFKQAQGACQDFARDLLLFHQVLMKTRLIMGDEDSHLSDSDRVALEACLGGCKELIHVQILGARRVPITLEEVGLKIDESSTDLLVRPRSAHGNLLQDLRQRVVNRQFALKIPKLQRAISSHIEKLTALNVLVIQSHQNEYRDTQEWMKKYVEESRNVLANLTSDHTSHIETISDRLETLQARIESQLEVILANQMRSTSPILSHSLDASSPEGRHTWMELGRLLRDEGITPAMIKQHRGILVDTMKNALKNQSSLAESTLQSYATAPEYKVEDSYPSATQPRRLSQPSCSPVWSPISLLGSAPPRVSGFKDSFLERQSIQQNVEDGMQSLLQGMSRDDFIAELVWDDGDYLIPGFESRKQVHVWIIDDKVQQVYRQDVTKTLIHREKWFLPYSSQERTQQICVHGFAVPSELVLTAGKLNATQLRCEVLME